MLEEIKLSSILATSWICWKIFRASHLSFTEDSMLWHAHMKHLRSMSLHKLDSICLDMTLWDSSITECKVCSLVKIKQQISQQSSDQTLIKSCQKIHIDWTDLKTVYKDFVRVMFITDHFSDMIFLYFMSMHEKKKENFHVLKNFVNWMSKKFDLKIKIIKSDNELAQKRTFCWLQNQKIEFQFSV